MKKIFVAGHKGMVGSAICRLLGKLPDVQVITRTRDELDLCNQQDVKNFFVNEKPDEVILAAAKVGGIYANNTYPGEFIYQNLQIQNNVIHCAHLNGVQKLLFLGSSCIYPKFADQPITENALLSGSLESTNEPYAIAKIAGIKLCESYNRQYDRDYRSIMPTNLYGPGDNYHPENSHVVPALIRRFHDAKVNQLEEVIVWGTGKPMREFLYVDDMADASLFIHNLNKHSLQDQTEPMLTHVNIGTGVDVTIKTLSILIKKVVGYEGKLTFDHSKPDGTPRKLTDITLMRSTGWSPKIQIEKGVAMAYQSFLGELSSGSLRE